MSSASPAAAAVGSTPGRHDPEEYRMTVGEHLEELRKRLDYTLDALKRPHLSLSLRDLSAGGLSALSDTPIDAGERVSLFFPPHGPMRGWDAYGRVVRCEASTFGYRVAVEFDTLPAA